MAGCEVEAHADGEGALHALNQKSFDVVVSDINLPGLTGVELLRRIRAYDLDIPVILLTGDPRLETAIEAVELGALQYLAKPIDHDVLVRSVDRAVRLHRIARAKRDALSLLGENQSQPGDRAGLIAAFDRMLDTLWPAFQPIVDAAGKVVAYEALMRSQEPALPDPGAVLSAAETLERVHAVGTCMRDRIADAFSTAGDGVMLFVNVHPLDLADPHLADPASALTRFAGRVVLEVTERASLDRVQNLQPALRTLRDLGFRIALDDLGAGFAGLTSFALLEPDIVKLDMSLVRGIDGSEVRQRIVGSMTTLCHQLGMNVVAEGVETAGERDTVSGLGCHWQQGYFFAKPGPAFPELARSVS